MGDKIGTSYKLKITDWFPVIGLKSYQSRNSSRVVKDTEDIKDGINQREAILKVYNLSLFGIGTGGVLHGLETLIR